MAQIFPYPDLRPEALIPQTLEYLQPAEMRPSLGSVQDSRVIWPKVMSLFHRQPVPKE